MISSFDQDLTPYKDDAKGQALEHMELFKKMSESGRSGCGKVLSVGWFESSIPACPFCSEGSPHVMFMDVGEK